MTTARGEGGRRPDDHCARAKRVDGPMTTARAKRPDGLNDHCAGGPGGLMTTARAREEIRRLNDHCAR